MSIVKSTSGVVAMGVMGTLGVAQADQIYSADFSTPGIGWVHTTDNMAPPPPATAVGPNFILGYDSVPATDTTSNWFETRDGVLSTSDWGDSAYFKSIDIDVTGYSDATIQFVGDTIGSAVFNNAALEYFEWYYSLDGGTPVSQITTSDGSLNKTFAGVDLTGVSTLVVGFNFNVNGAGDGFEFSSITVDATPITGGLDGDLDNDGFVGIADLNIVLGLWNQNVTPGSLLDGDPSGDGFVGIEDLNTILGNWNAGTPPTAAGAAVPEPASLALLGLGGMAVLKRRR